MTNIKESVANVAESVATTPPAEGKWTKQIENQTAKIPSVFFLNLALSSIAISAISKLITRKENTTANFVGLWAPTFLLLGIYNKLVKIEGNDRYNRA